MKCLKCGYDDSKVLDSRMTEENKKIRRRRECVQCGYRFTTYESYERQPLIIVKSNGRKEEYDRNKVVKSLKLCFAKRIDDFEIIEEIVENLEFKLEKADLVEVKAETIAQIVLDELMKIDKISYLIYACNIYKYKTLSEVENLIKRMEQLSF